jgi:glycogen debranching enzyme
MGTIQESLSIHLNGLKFRERNAGKQIDEHMRDEGFNNEIGVDLNTGFVYGGNEFNCGTWMDKMGSSSRAGNKGLPSTPRDGSAVELVGLSRCVLEWLIYMNSKSFYPYDGAVLAKNGQKVTWKEWAQKIDQNFEKYFWIDASNNDSPHINKRNIYKDTLNSSQPWTDYQLRPNFLIAMTVAPQMLSKSNAQKALEAVRQYLLNESNTIGIKTLEESDWSYCGFYDNSNDSNDKRIANGANYHNGPEWLWPVGYYLRSELKFNGNVSLEMVKKHLGKLYDSLQSTDWKSLPELTNKNGESCYYSCPSQAWSLATTLEVFYDLANL